MQTGGSRLSSWWLGVVVAVGGYFAWDIGSPGIGAALLGLGVGIFTFDLVSATMAGCREHGVAKIDVLAEKLLVGSLAFAAATVGISLVAFEWAFLKTFRWLEYPRAPGASSPNLGHIAAAVAVGLIAAECVAIPFRWMIRPDDLWRLVVPPEESRVLPGESGGIESRDEGKHAPQRLHLRLKLWRLMVAVAVIAVVCAAVRSESAGSAGIAIVGTSVFVLACKRFSEALALRESQGLTTSRPRKARLFLVSSAVAASIVLLSDLAFLAGYHFILYFPRTSSHSGGGRWSSPEEFALSTVIGAALGLVVASSLRRSLWPLGLTASERRRRFLEWRPGVVAVCIAIFIGMYMAWEVKDLLLYMIGGYH